MAKSYKSQTINGTTITLSAGNLKMDDTLIFNIPAQKTCIGSTALCRKFCYARKAERLYPTVLPCREANLLASKEADFVDTLIKTIAKATKSGKIQHIRMHESGDFYSQEYLQAWYTVAQAFPSLKFLAFTKSWQLAFSGCPSNLKLIYSIWADTEHIAEGISSQASAGECGDVDAIPCKGHCTECRACWYLKEGQNVHFDLH